MNESRPSSTSEIISPPVTTIETSIAGSSMSPAPTASPQQFIAAQIGTHSGPLPSPETLDQYHRIDPTLVGRIFDQAEREQRHRHKMHEESLVLHQRDLERARDQVARGQTLGAILVATAIIGAVVTAALGATMAAGVLGLGALTQIVAVIVTGERAKAQKNEIQSEAREVSD